MTRLSGIEYRMRSFYPNYFSLQQALNGTGEGNPPALEAEFRKPELEYRRRGEKAFHELLLTNTDVLILNQPDRKLANRYLELLIASSVKDPSALEEKNILMRNFMESLRSRLDKLAFKENMMVVPASTTNPYDDILLSQKGKVLLDLYQEGYPVPDFCILTSQSYQLSGKEREACLLDSISNLEKMTGEILGDANRALVFALRSATPYYIPGVMPTYLNVGVTKTSLKSLEKQYGKEVAGKIYLNNLQNISQIL